MPYIDNFKKQLIDDKLEPLSKLIINPKDNTIDYGMFEYLIFKLMYDFTEVNKRFSNMNALVGICETTKAEYTDKVLKPYENAKLLDGWIKNKAGEFKKPRIRKPKK